MPIFRWLGPIIDVGFTNHYVFWKCINIGAALEDNGREGFPYFVIRRHHILIEIIGILGVESIGRLGQYLGEMSCQSIYVDCVIFVYQESKSFVHFFYSIAQGIGP